MNIEIWADKKIAQVDVRSGDRPSEVYRQHERDGPVRRRKPAQEGA